MTTTPDDARPAAPPLIRLATPQDLPAIEDLDRLSASPTRDIHRDVEKYFGSVDPSTHERTLIFLVQVGEFIAGKAELMTPPPQPEGAPTNQDILTRASVGYVKRVVVDPRFRKLGLARAMMLHIIAYAQSDLRLSAIDLHVWEDNQPAIRLYESLGFHLQHRELYFRLPLYEIKFSKGDHKGTPLP
ncbi:MAG TPA: N-acetyltransferase [Ktedonobacteraceae bacterium]|nr:N-acetyltransferase [Ktedonobacteraceae bacterium]